MRRHDHQIRRLVLHRQNSFTCARRFLVPQVLLSAVFAAAGHPARFADLGTGLGIVPRALDDQTLFDRFAPDLRWPEGVPLFRPVPLVARFGVERGPLPDLAWVNACHGASPYYDGLFAELTLALDATRPAAADVRHAEIDLLDSGRLHAFLRGNRVNCANLSYVLYELRPETRPRLVDGVLAALSAPGVLVVTEPRDELAGAGCTVTVYSHQDPPMRVLRISDGHFRGHVHHGDDYARFVRRFPIRFAVAPVP